MPNPLHKLACGSDLFTSFALMWANDVGGTVTKPINAHKNIYLAHSNLPGALLQQEFFVHFVSMSQHATTPEQFEAIKTIIECADSQTHKDPPLTYNAHTKCMCHFHIVIPGLPADNLQQSKLCSHIGPSGNCKCHHCYVSGTAAHMEMNEGYHALHEPGTPRTLSTTKEEIRRQLETATQGSMGTVKDLQTASGIKDKFAQIWIKRIIEHSKHLKADNLLWTLEEIHRETLKWLDDQVDTPWILLLEFAGLDPHRDTPVEILHTILLGIIKYVWHNLHTTMTEQNWPKFVIMPFHVPGLVTNDQFILIKAVGLLCALVWYHEIANLPEYIVSDPLI
ncbi:hypothetical protein K439DRAFT_1644037 [Ramaria rubella]|nr:hypothetical protein K439DRAFT_1644037 [Ramaria rubella]